MAFKKRKIALALVGVLSIAVGTYVFNLVGVLRNQVSFTAVGGLDLGPAWIWLFGPETIYEGSWDYPFSQLTLLAVLATAAVSLGSAAIGVSLALARIVGDRAHLSTRVIVTSLFFASLGWSLSGYFTSDFNVLSLFALVATTFALLSEAIARVAEEKGRSYRAFLLLSLVVSPIIMGIVTAAISPTPGSKRYITPLATDGDLDSTTGFGQIEKLGALAAQGLITQAEFEAKKKEILARL